MKPNAAMVAAIALLAASCAPSARFAEPVAPTAEWRELVSDRFGLVTDLDEREARRALGELTKTYDVLHDVVFPDAAATAHRLRVVIFRREAEYRAYAMRGADAFVMQRLPFGAERAGAIVLWGEVDARNSVLVAHELAHVFARLTYPWMPVWLNEGLAEYASTIRVWLGDAYMGRTPRHIGRWIRPMLPRFDALVSMPPSRFYAAQAVSTGLSGVEGEALIGNYAAAWAAVHMFMNGPRRASFDEYLNRLRHGERDAAWDAVFGRTSQDDLQRELDEHIVRQTGVVWKTPYAYPERETKVAILPLSPSDVLVLRGRLIGNAARSTLFFQEAARLAPNAAAPHLALARSLPTDEARRIEADRGLALEPMSPAAIHLVAVLLAHDRSKITPRPPPSAREQQLWTALVRGAPTAGQLSDAARTMALDGHAAEALDLAKRSVQLEQLCHECMDTYAETLAGVGDLTAACTAQRRAIQLAPEGQATADLEQRLRKLELARAKAQVPKP